MLKTVLTCAATWLLITGCAGSPSTPKPAPATASVAKPPCVGAAAASRIPQSNCSPGQTYTQDDIQSTGQPGASGALQMLDPLVHH